MRSIDHLMNSPIGEDELRYLTKVYVKDDYIVEEASIDCRVCRMIGCWYSSEGTDRGYGLCKRHNAVRLFFDRLSDIVSYEEEDKLTMLLEENKKKVRKIVDLVLRVVSKMISSGQI